MGYCQSGGRGGVDASPVSPIIFSSIAVDCAFLVVTSITQPSDKWVIAGTQEPHYEGKKSHR